MKRIQKNKFKICFVSSSGGHYEQLRQLKPLAKKYDAFWVTEHTDFACGADYYLDTVGSNDRLVLIKMAIIGWKAIHIWLKEKPDMVVTTGALIAIPFLFLGKITGKKTVYIETFARVEDCSKAGRFAYKIADLFIYQWKSLAKLYPKGVYGGSIY